MENLSTDQAVRTLAPADDRMADPVAVRFAPEPARAIVTTSRGTIAAFDLAGRPRGIRFLRLPAVDALASRPRTGPPE